MSPSWLEKFLNRDSLVPEEAACRSEVKIREVTGERRMNGASS